MLQSLESKSRIIEQQFIELNAENYFKFLENQKERDQEYLYNLKNPPINLSPQEWLLIKNPDFLEKAKLSLKITNLILQKIDPNIRQSQKKEKKEKWQFLEIVSIYCVFYNWNLRFTSSLRKCSIFGKGFNLFQIFNMKRSEQALKRKAFRISELFKYEMNVEMLEEVLEILQNNEEDTSQIDLCQEGKQKYIKIVRANKSKQKKPKIIDREMIIERLQSITKLPKDVLLSFCSKWNFDYQKCLIELIHLID